MNGRLLFLLLAVFPLMTFAEQIDGIRYSGDMNSGDSYIPYKAAVREKKEGKYSGDVVIPESVTFASWGSTKTYKVTSIRDGAFSGCTGLTSVTIPCTDDDHWEQCIFGVYILEKHLLEHAISTVIGNWSFHFGS